MMIYAAGETMFSKGFLYLTIDPNVISHLSKDNELIRMVQFHTKMFQCLVEISSMSR